MMRNKLARFLKSRTFGYIRLLVGISLIILLFRIADLDKLKAVSQGLRKELVLVAFACLVVDRLCLAVRWSILLHAKRITIPFGQVARLFFISYFFGNFLPSTLAPDVIRIHRVMRYTRDMKTVLSSTIVDRMIGSFALALIIGFSLITITLSGTLPLDTRSLMISLVFLTLSIGLPVVLWHNRMKKVADFIFNRSGILKKVHAFFEAFYSYRHQKRAILKVFMIAFLNMFNKMFVFFVLFAALGQVLPTIYFLLFMPLTWLAGIVPISVGELGIVEGGVVFLFSRIGLQVEVCLAVGLIYRSLWLLATLPGGPLYIMDTMNARKKKEHCEPAV